MRCDQCEVAIINGVRCHEQGCPEAWRDKRRECQECGQDFLPDTRYQITCSVDCWEAFHGEPCVAWGES